MCRHSVGERRDLRGMGGPRRPSTRLGEAGNWKRWSPRFIAHHLLLSLVCTDTKVSVHFTLNVTSVSRFPPANSDGKQRRSCCFCRWRKQLRRIAWPEAGVTLLSDDVLLPQVSQQLNYLRNGWDCVEHDSMRPGFLDKGISLWPSGSCACPVTREFGVQADPGPGSGTVHSKSPQKGCKWYLHTLCCEYTNARLCCQ